MSLVNTVESLEDEESDRLEMGLETSSSLATKEEKTEKKGRNEKHAVVCMHNHV